VERRAFIGTVGGALLAMPLVATAQQVAGMPRVGYLGPTSPSSEAFILEAFRQGLRDVGYREGQNIGIDYRWAEGQDERLPDLAAELVRLKVNVIVTPGTPGSLAAMRATRTIPIVMTSTGDPVKSGLVASLARPGGNVTGFSTFRPQLEGKRLELFKQAVPKLSRVAVLRDPINPIGPFQLQEIQGAARAAHIALQPVVEVRRAEELERSFSTIMDARSNGLFVEAGRSLFAHRQRIVDLAASHRLPGSYPYPEYAAAGGLMSYSPNFIDLYRGAAVYVDKILRGMNPADLPVQQSTKFDLVINLKTAKALGLTIPPSLLLRADQVIE